MVPRKVAVLVLLGVGGASGCKGDSPAQPTVAVSSSALAASSSGAHTKGQDAALPKQSLSTGEMETVALLRKLDELRANAFDLQVLVPPEPQDVVVQPGETEFAVSERKKQHAQDVRVYQAALRTMEHQWTGYLKHFSPSWETLIPDDAESAKKPTALDAAARGAGKVPKSASCRVLDVGGKCEKVCMKRWSDAGLQRVPPARCVAVDEMRREGGFRADESTAYWSQTCTAKFVCAADAPLTVAKPGLKYSASGCVINFSKSYTGAAAEADAATFHSRIAGVKPGSDVSFPKVRSWKFNRQEPPTWWAEASPDDGWPATSP
jgi:hypothetical protein